MKKPFVTLLIVVFAFVLRAQTIEVKQDGSGDYTQIQEAVDASMDGQTVLVWPGTYFENVNLSGKDITLASLALTTGEEAYRDSTIINGNQTGSCIRVIASGGIATIAQVYGFTLTGGSGTADGSWLNGGGLFLSHSTVEVSHCIITYNNAAPGMGGGIYVYFTEANINNCVIRNNYSTKGGGGIIGVMYSNLTLNNNIVNNNHTHYVGGGICIGYKATVHFDTINRCSIYENFAMLGCDIHDGNLEQPLVVVVDTFTVINPDSYFISSISDGGYQVDISFDALHSKITPYDGDIYIDPVLGDNNNSGISPEEPLQSAAWAYSKIAVDSLERNTIHLANGIYSDSSNNEKFPLNVRPYINMVGQTSQGTIFDGMYKSQLLRGNNEVSNYSFSNLYMIRGSQADYVNIFRSEHIFVRLYIQRDNISFDSVTFDGGVSLAGNGAVSIVMDNNLKMSNCTFKNTKGERVLHIADGLFEDTARIWNCRFINNQPDYDNPLYVTGGGVHLVRNRAVALVTNCLFEYNATDAFLSNNSQVWMSNCTFVNNTSPGTSIPVYIRGSKFHMYNCILYDNNMPNFWVTYTETHNSELYINHSLIEGGEESITVTTGASLEYDTATNIDADPVFTGVGENPYQIDYGSPCIDAGTLDLPSFLKIPELDLAGNPRVVGPAIDMGAYEWNPTVGFGKPIIHKKETIINVAPNPFRSNTRITVKTMANHRITLEVYNNSGQRVKVLMHGPTFDGETIVNWNGEDEYSTPLPSGIYYVVLAVDGREVEEVKLIKQ